MKKAVSILLALCAAVSAQSPLGLHFPLGMPVQAVTGPSSSMAGSGTGVHDEYIGMSLNPANMAISNRSAFSSLVSMDFTQVNENNASSSIRDYSPRLLSLILPAGQAGNIGFSVEKRSDAALTFLNNKILQNTETEFNSTYIGIVQNGGLTAWQAGWGYRFGNGPSIGISYERLYFNTLSDRVFGSVSKEFSTNGTKIDTFKTEHNLVEKSIFNFTGNGFRMGALLPFGKLSVGIAGEYVFHGEGTLKSVYEKTDATETNPSRTVSLHLPPSLSAGVGYELSPEWLLAGDLQATLWERYNTNLDTPRDLRRAYRVSAGTRYIPAPNQLTAQYWETIHYRGGIRYNQLPVDGTQESALSLGVGLPIANDDGLIDVVFELGKRTDSRFSNYSDTFFKLQLGINGGRNWFNKKETLY